MASISSPTNLPCPLAGKSYHQFACAPVCLLMVFSLTSYFAFWNGQLIFDWFPWVFCGSCEERSCQVGNCIIAIMCASVTLGKCSLWPPKLWVLKCFIPRTQFIIDETLPIRRELILIFKCTALHCRHWPFTGSFGGVNLNHLVCIIEHSIRCTHWLSPTCGHTNCVLFKLYIRFEKLFFLDIDSTSSVWVSVCFWFVVM